MTIGGRTFTVTQAGQPCTFSISPSSSNLTLVCRGERNSDGNGRHQLRLDGGQQ